MRSFFGKGVVNWNGNGPRDAEGPVGPYGFHSHTLQQGRKLALATPSPGLSVRCLLCGGVISSNDETDEEHPLSSWLLKYTGTLSSPLVELDRQDAPSRNDFRFIVHKHCNQEFGTKLEAPASNVVKKMVEGRMVKRRELEVAFDWLDKIRTTVCLTFLQTQGRLWRYGISLKDYPNLRVGRSDRLMFLFRVRGTRLPSLGFSEALSRGFQSTPSALALRIKDLVILTVSDAHLLSSTFGLWDQGQHGTGLIARTQLAKTSKIAAYASFLQPMRPDEANWLVSGRYSAVHSDGYGKLFGQTENGLQTLPTTGFDCRTIPTLEEGEGTISAILDVTEWLIACKQRSKERLISAGVGLEGRDFFLRSMPGLRVDQHRQAAHLANLRYGLSPAIDYTKLFPIWWGELFSDDRARFIADVDTPEAQSHWAAPYIRQLLRKSS